MKLEKIKQKLLQKEKSITKQGYGRVLPKGLSFLKTEGVFKGNNGNCYYNAVKEEGYSYSWWTMVKRIKGRLVLNSYYYSNQTAKHIGKMQELFSTLNIDYIKVPAPKGLQNLDSSQSHLAHEMGKAIVQNKYARNKHNRSIKFVQRQIDALSKIGLKITKKMISEGILAAEIDREKRNQRQGEKIKFIDGTEENASKSGLHIFHEGYVSYNDHNKYEAEAKTKSFKRVFIHRTDYRLNKFEKKVETFINE